MSDESQGREHDKPQADAAPEVDGRESGKEQELDPMQVTAEVEDLKDQRLRMAAEMENLRRRTARDDQGRQELRHFRLRP
jgi:molecular chaperone GrpE